MELQLLPIRTNIIEPIENLISTSKPFIEANTIESSLDEIRNKHTIPAYAKDNERLISIAEFIDSTNEVIQNVFRGEQILPASIRCSHAIKGRIPEAKYKSPSELEEHERTLYFERTAFIFELPSIQAEIGGHTHSLTIGGIKNYSADRLHSKKGADEFFSFFIGFQNKVCTNMNIFTDGFQSNVGVKSLGQLKALLRNLFESYNSSHHLHHLRRLTDFEISEVQFAQLIGKSRMYQYLPTELKSTIRPLLFGESQLNIVMRGYYNDSTFCREENGSISLYNLLNLFTNAAKASYVDTFLDKSINAYDFVEQIRWSLEDQGHSCWFLN